MSDAPGAEGGDADPQSQPPAGHLVGEPETINSACLSSRAAPGDTAVTPAETSIPGGGSGYLTRSTGRPVPYSLGPRDSVVFDEQLLPKGQSAIVGGHLALHTSGEYL